MIVCPFVPFLVAIGWSVLLQVTASDFSTGIFKRLLFNTGILYIPVDGDGVGCVLPVNINITIYK